MGSKIRFYALVLLCPLAVSPSWVWAQGHSTDGGQSFTQGSSTVSPGPAIQDHQGGVPATPPKKPKKKPVVLDFDTLPPSPWSASSCDGVSGATADNGILTINSFSCYEYILWHPDDIWHQYVDNTRGWVIEARLRLDPISVPEELDRGAVHIWANDHVNLLIVGFDPNEVRLSYPNVVQVPMNTTDMFHTYRIESKLNRVKLYVDDVLKIDHILTWTGGGSDILNFGDGAGSSRSLSYWDYFSYDVFP